MVSEKTQIRVRFNEVDSLCIVWHGHYLKYFEDAREAFGRKYGLGYLEMYDQGFVTPIVSIRCDYKLPLSYGDEAVVEIVYRDTKAARIEMEYRITSAASGALVATGSSTQVFLDRNTQELQLTLPGFFEEWKKKWGIPL
jgi:acyl-CoA thioester hydrolase